MPNEESTMPNEESKPETLQWINNSIHPSDFASMKSYGEHIMRNQIILKLWSWTDSNDIPTNDVYIFGGLLRRQLVANYNIKINMTDKLQDDIKSQNPNIYLPTECFVKSGTDIDIFFENQTLIDEFILTLKQDFNIMSTSTTSSGYNGCKATKVRLASKFQIFGPIMKIRLDLVTKLDEACELLVDFSVNSLQMDQNRKISCRGQNSDSLRISSDMANLSQTHDIIQEITSKTTTAIVYSSAYFLTDLKEHSNLIVDNYIAGVADPLIFNFNLHFEKYMKSTTTMCTDTLKEIVETNTNTNGAFCYVRYLNNLIRNRLYKMMRDGWYITNLSPTITLSDGCGYRLPCGHEWRRFQDRISIEIWNPEIAQPLLYCEICDEDMLLFRTQK